jgi:hypothetical protein
MFVDPRYISDDMESNDDEIMEFNGLMTMEQSDLPMGGIVGFNEIINSSTPMEKIFAQLVIIILKITSECKEGDVKFCEHATSHVRVLTCNVHNICLTKMNVILHPRLVLPYIEN